MWTLSSSGWFVFFESQFQELGFKMESVDLISRLNVLCSFMNEKCECIGLVSGNTNI